MYMRGAHTHIQIHLDTGRCRCIHQATARSSHHIKVGAKTKRRAQFYPETSERWSLMLLVLTCLKFSNKCVILVQVMAWTYL